MDVKTSFALSLVFSCAALMTEIKADFDPHRPPLGGWWPAQATDPRVQEAGRKAATHLETVKNSAMAYRLHRLISAKSQVVAGTNYKLQLLIAQTDCHRGSSVDIERCRPVKIQKCIFVVHYPLHGESPRVIGYKCGSEKPITGSKGSKTTTRPPPGGIVEIDVSSKEAETTAAFATQELSSRSDGRYKVRKQRIVKAATQVVADKMYHLTIDVSVTFTENNETKRSRCDVKVWDQAWRTPRYVLSEYKCDRHIA